MMEPPRTIYSFIIVNETGKSLFINYQDINNNQGCDTLNPNRSFMKNMYQFCFNEYNDTLIKSFFSEMKIRLDTGMLNINPYKRSNWVESKALRGSGSCKGGRVCYTLTVYN